MTEKEVRRLNRSDLIEIIYELQKQNKENSERIRSLEQELEDRSLKLSKAGSIAEAAIQVNNVLESAQAAADQYLSSIRTANASVEKKLEKTQRQCDEMVRRAQSEADRLLTAAKEQAAKTVADADRQAAEAWMSFQAKTNSFIKSHAELRALITGDTK